MPPSPGKLSVELGGETGEQAPRAVDHDRAEQNRFVVEFDAFCAAQQLVVEEPELSPGESSAQAKVLATAKGEVPVRLAAHVETLRFGEYVLRPGWRTDSRA